MRSLFFYLVLYALCVGNTSTFAQILKFEQLTTLEGLPSSEVYNLFQDKQGYIWAFTENGIVKHNGSRFTPVCRNLPLEESAVYVVRESLKGDMYIANSNARIYRIRNDSAFLLPGFKELSKKILSNNDVMFDMLVDDPSGRIYLSTLRRSYLFSNNRITELPARARTDSGFTDFKKARDKYVLIRPKVTERDKHQIRVVDERDRVLCRVPSIAVPNDRSNIRVKKGMFYFLSQAHVRKWSQKSGITTLTLGEPAITIEVSPDGHIWVGTVRGLYELDPDLNILHRYLEDCIVSDVLFDNRNGMWVSTIERGIFYCSNINTLYYDDIKELAGNISMLKTIDDQLFIGTSGGHLFVKKNAHHLMKVAIGDSNLYLTDISFFDHKYFLGSKWKITTMDRDLKVIDRNAITIKGGGGPSGSYGFASSGNGRLLVVTGSAIVIKDKKNRKDTKTIITTTKTRCIARREKDYAIGTIKGLFLLDDKSYSLVFLDPFRGKAITKLESDRKGNTWICTKYHGLYLLLPDNRILRLSNTPSNTINHIHFIHDTLLILSTNKGLFKNTLKAALAGSGWELVLNKEVSDAVIHGDDIYVATKQGMISMSMSRLFQNPEIAFYAESVKTRDRNIDLNDMHLSHIENDLYFNFAILAPGNLEQQVSWQLEGTSAGEGLSGTQLHLQNLNPGIYTLTVIPVIDNKKYPQHKMEMSFEVEAAFWQTSLFRITAVLFILGILTLILRREFLQLKKREARKAEILRQLAEYHLTALKAQINPHFISNSLSAMQMLILSNEVDKANQYLAKFSLFIRYVLDYSDRFVTSLHDELKIIDINVELEQLRFNNKFSFQKEISPEICLTDIFVPPLITQPIIENAIWHGLLPLKGKRIPKLLVKIDIEEANLIISVIDNGVGRTLTGKESRERVSRGTSLIEQWIENLNKLFGTHGASIHFIDLMDKWHRPAGTQVNIRFSLDALNRLHHEKNKKHSYR